MFGAVLSVFEKVFTPFFALFVKSAKYQFSTPGGYKTFSSDFYNLFKELY